jgi:hypothetical protein
MLGQELPKEVETKYIPKTKFDKVFFESNTAANAIFPQSHLAIISSFISRISENPSVNLPIFLDYNFSSESIDELQRRVNEAFHPTKGIGKIQRRPIELLLLHTKLLTLNAIANFISKFYPQSNISGKDTRDLTGIDLDELVEISRQLSENIKRVYELNPEVVTSIYKDMGSFFSCIERLIINSSSPIFPLVKDRLHLFNVRGKNNQGKTSWWGTLWAGLMRKKINERITRNNKQSQLAITLQIWDYVLDVVFNDLPDHMKARFETQEEFDNFFVNRLIKKIRGEI